MSVIVVTGIQAAGKSTVAQALAERLEKSVHVRGDLFRRMIINGRVNMGPAEALRQLKLRYAIASNVADMYASGGFTVVLQDIVLGHDLPDMVAAIEARPLYVVVLAPRADIVTARDDARRVNIGKVAYRPGDEGVTQLDSYLRRQTPRIGLWLDTSDQTVDETVDEILARVWTEGVLRAHTTPE